MTTSLSHVKGGRQRLLLPVGANHAEQTWDAGEEAGVQVEKPLAASIFTDKSTIAEFLTKHLYRAK